MMNKDGKWGIGDKARWTIQRGLGCWDEKAEEDKNWIL